MSEIGGEKRENPLLLLLLSLLLPSLVDSLSYECKDNQVLVVQSFGNDTIRMHCQLLQLCGYEKLECEYDHNQPKCGGQTNFVAAVQQPATSAEVEHRCCNLFNGRSPHMIPTHTGNDCFIYELPDGSGAGKKEGEEKLEGTPEGPAEEAPLAILKSASEIPEQIDGVSGYRLRLFLLRNKSPPTLLVKGIERRADGYRITICRPQCVAPEEAERSPLVAAGTPEGWKAISWSSWSTNTWTSWARSRFGAEAAVAGAAEAARKRTSISTGSDRNLTKASAVSDGAAASAAASASASMAREGSGGKGGGNEQKQGNINIFIHTGDMGRRKRIGSDSDEGRHGSGRGEWTSGGSKEDDLLRELEEATRKIHQQREREKRRREKEREEEAERKREREKEEEKRRREREREEEAERKREREEEEKKRKDEKERELREKERKRKEEEEKRKEREEILRKEKEAKELKKTDEARLEELRRNELESKKKKEITISDKKPNGSQKEEEEIIEETEENVRIKKKKEKEEEEEIIEVVEEKGKGKEDEKKIKSEDKKKGGGKGIGVDEEVVLVEETEIVRKGERREPPKDVNQEEVAEGDEDDNARDDEDAEVETTPTVTAATSAATTARAAAEMASSTPSTRMSSAASAASTAAASTAAATTPAPTPPPAADSPSRDAPASPPQEQPASGMARAVKAMNCFSGDSLVSTTTGTKRMRDLQVGDFVLVPAAGNVQKYEAVEMFYHREPSRKTSFVQILTANGRRISLTPLHLLPFGDCDSLQRSLEKMEGLEETLGASRFAYKALPGDCLLTLGSDGVFHADPIVKVGRQVSEGMFSPMTVEGSLVVDGVLVSCFSQLESHSLHKIIFDLLLRIQSWLSYQPAFSPSPDLAIPSFINYVHKLSHYVLPFATF